MLQVIRRIWKALERHDMWVERFRWKAILLDSVLWMLGYAVASYLLFGQIDVLGLLVLALIFPAGLAMVRARRSITVGKLLYVCAGVALGIFLGSLGFLALLAMGFDVSFLTLLIVYTLALPGAWLGYFWGKRKGFLMPGSSK